MAAAAASSSVIAAASGAAAASAAPAAAAASASRFADIARRRRSQAGSLEESFKHVILCRILKHIRDRHEGRLSFLDLYAGPVGYAVGKSQGFDDASLETYDSLPVHDRGANLLWQVVRKNSFEDGTGTELLKPFFKALNAYNPPPEGKRCAPHIDFVPRAHSIARFMLRSSDQHVLVESEPTTARMLKEMLGADRRVQVLHKDPVAASRSLLPLRSSRGVVWVDPPFASANEWSDLMNAVQTMPQRWPLGTFVFCYPIRNRPIEMDHEPQLAIYEALQEMGVRDVVGIEMMSPQGAITPEVEAEMDKTFADFRKENEGTLTFPKTHRDHFKDKDTLLAGLQPDNSDIFDRWNKTRKQDMHEYEADAQNTTEVPPLSFAELVLSEHPELAEDVDVSTLSAEEREMRELAHQKYQTALERDAHLDGSLIQNISDVDLNKKVLTMGSLVAPPKAFDLENIRFADYSDPSMIIGVGMAVANPASVERLEGEASALAAIISAMGPDQAKGISELESKLEDFAKEVSKPSFDQLPRSKSRQDTEKFIADMRQWLDDAKLGSLDKTMPEIDDMCKEVQEIMFDSPQEETTELMRKAFLRRKPIFRVFRPGYFYKDYRTVSEDVGVDEEDVQKMYFRYGKGPDFAVMTIGEREMKMVEKSAEVDKLIRAEEEIDEIRALHKRYLTPDIIKGLSQWRHAALKDAERRQPIPYGAPAFEAARKHLKQRGAAVGTEEEEG